MNFVQVSPSVVKGLIPPELTKGIDLPELVNQVTDTEMRKALEKHKGRAIPELDEAANPSAQDFVSAIEDAIKAGGMHMLQFKLSNCYT